MSPIETMLLTALREFVPAAFTLYDRTDPEDDAEYGCGDAEIHMSRQATLLSYRADILLEVENEKICVECDGHDFHERTKQQAAYDRSRDRELLAAGVLTIRFTGSEIVHSPERCAADVYAVVRAVEDRHWAAIRAWSAGYESGVDSTMCPPRDLTGVNL